MIPFMLSIFSAIVPNDLDFAHSSIAVIELAKPLDIAFAKFRKLVRIPADATLAWSAKPPVSLLNSISLS